jgi:hypothetical protein
MGWLGRNPFNARLLSRVYWIGGEAKGLPPKDWIAKAVQSAVT